MKWLRRLGIAAVVLVAIAGAAYWYYVLDGAVPAATAYKTDVAGWRALIASDAAMLPNEARIEFVGRDTMPSQATQAGAEHKAFARTRVAIQLEGPQGSVIIDTAMDQATAEQSQQGDDKKFDAEAFGRVIAAMGVAAKVAVTHEHRDHIGGVLSFPVPERLAERLVLTKEQFEGLSATSKTPVPPAYASIQHLDLTQPARIAPGVVMIPAPGHTRGSAMFFVKLADGHELLFIGDIAWAFSNVRDAVTRPRFVQQLYMSGEDRVAVADQIRALHNLLSSEPALTIIPAHDAAYFDELIASGLLKTGFVVGGP